MGRVNFLLTEEQLAKLKQKKEKVMSLILGGIDLSGLAPLKDVVEEPLTLVVTVHPGEGIACKYATNLNADEIEGIDIVVEETPTEEEEKEERERRTRRPNWNFYNLGLNDGDKICFDGNENEVATIISRKGVEYEGEEFDTLAALTQIIGNYGEHVNPIYHWSFQGRQLNEIYDERFPKM